MTNPIFKNTMQAAAFLHLWVSKRRLQIAHATSNKMSLARGTEKIALDNELITVYRGAVELTQKGWDFGYEMGYENHPSVQEAHNSKDEPRGIIGRAAEYIALNKVARTRTHFEINTQLAQAYERQALHYAWVAECVCVEGAAHKTYLRKAEQAHSTGLHHFNLARGYFG